MEVCVCICVCVCVCVGGGGGGYSPPFFDIYRSPREEEDYVALWTLPTHARARKIIISILARPVQIAQL